MKWSFLVWLFASVLFFTHSVTAQKPPFLVLNREEQQEAVHTTKQAVQWWLGRKYSNLYSLYSSAASFLNTEGFPESERKARFIKWCSAWRERNPYNSRLSEDEKIERLRTVDVSIKLLTGFVLMNMKSSYWDALTKGKWHRDTKIAFVEFHIRGRRYIQPLIREDKRWKILTIPLTFDEQMIREYEGLRGDGTDRPHLINGGASERLVPATTCVTCSGYCAIRRAVRRRRGGGRIGGRPMKGSSRLEAKRFCPNGVSLRRESSFYLHYPRRNLTTGSACINVPASCGNIGVSQRLTGHASLQGSVAQQTLSLSRSQSAAGLPKLVWAYALRSYLLSSSSVC